jgi:hypothetical protein
MSKNIKFNSIQEFVNYPHSEIISSKGFPEHDFVPPIIDHKKILGVSAKEILIKEIKLIENNLKSELSDDIEVDKVALLEFNSSLKVLEKDDFDLWELDESTNLSSELLFLISDEQIRVQAEENEADNGTDQEYSIVSYLQTKIGDDIYEVSILDARDLEGSNYHEEWKKNNVLHRYGGGPAEIKRSFHNIPEEVYMDESSKSYCIDGKEIKSEDCLNDSQKIKVDEHTMPGL